MPPPRVMNLWEMAQFDPGWDRVFIASLNATKIRPQPRSLMVIQPSDTATMATTDSISEFVKLYPNPAKQLINLAFKAQTSGQVYFEITDQLGEMVMQRKLGNGQNFAQYSTESLSSALYYWRLRDSERIVQTGKVVIMK